MLDEENTNDDQLDEDFSLEDDLMEATAREEEHLLETQANPAAEELASARNIPLTFTVELGRFEMPLDKLLKVEPGNIIDLALKPEEGVYLTLQGKRVAKAELVKIGEAIGVKILKVGH
jgi:flagellar motor switch protein FliN/FliY